MNSVLSNKRLDITGGMWTPKVGGPFQEGDASQTFLVKGRADIKELGGHLKLFMENIEVETRKVYLSEEEEQKIKEDYRASKDVEYQNIVEAGHGDFPSDEQRLETERKDLPELIALAQKEIENVQSAGIPAKLYVYLTRRKPKPRMNDAHTQGTRIHLPSKDGSGLFGKPGYVRIELY